MRFDSLTLLAALALALAGCDDKPTGPLPARFASVKKSVTSASQPGFCDQSYPARGEGAHRFVPPALRPLAGVEGAPRAKGWRWLNLWATWCSPCVEEMGVLNRWNEALARDGVAVTFELMSVDEADAQPALEQWQRKALAGSITWLRSPDALPAFLEGLGVDRGVAIPIHVVVDPAGMVRCVRVGAIHDQDYGAVKALLSGT